MSFLKEYFWNIALTGLLVFVAYKQIPLWLHSNKQIGKKVLILPVLDLKTERKFSLKSDEKKVYIFWATWCTPCHLQLAQFERAVSKGNLDQKSIVAVSLDKSLETVKEFVKESKYSFLVVVASPEQKWLDLNVQATPSIAFVDKNQRVENFFTGLSPLSVYRAQSFLK